jgi:dipeptidyl aminopeptidase/acylaminoacyl peptidase
MRRISTLAGLLLCTFAAVAVCVGQQTRRLMAPADILRLANISDAQVSPNGEWVVYSVSTVSGDQARSTLWLARAGQTSLQTTQPLERRTPRNPPTPLLPPDWNASNARWSPDSGTIAFITTREGATGIWTVTVNRREPRFIAPIQSTNFFITYAGEALAWAPDSKRIAYISATEVQDATPDDSTANDPRVIDRIQYKSRTSFSDNRRSHVWIVDVTKPEPRQLTTGAFYDHAITFSPRGDEIAFLSNHEPDPDANNNSDIFAVDVNGQVRQITQTRGCEYDPVWSPDGRWIAYTATKREVTTIDSVAEDTHLWVTSASGDERREVSSELDRRVRSPRWDREGRRLFFLAGDSGNTTIYRVRVNGGKVDRLSLFTVAGELGARFDIDDPVTKAELGADVSIERAFQITSFTVATRANPLGPSTATPVSSASPMVFIVGTPVEPGEVWFGISSNQPLRRLSAHNDGFKKSYDLSEPETFDFKSFDGKSVQGWLMKPVGWRSDRSYPLILSIHGGPHGMFGASFSSTFQVYASKGYAVLYINPRGSSGYGQRFSDGTLNEWGGGDYKDLMAGLDEALRKNSWIDANRLGVTGGSYGGFMTNWIITQTPRFKAAVASASVSNLISFYSTSMYQDLIHAEFGGFPWDNYDRLWEWSPMRYVRQVQTPTLFIHGELDNDVHITQAEEMYMALKRLRVETVLVRYPREGHGLREPRHRVDALERTLAWFDRFLK